MTRHLNRLWNYLLKGFLGTILILFLFPILCISVSFISICFAIAAPLWIPIITILLHLYMMLIYDLDSPNDDRNKYCVFFEALGWDLLFQGILQPIAATFVAIIICPIISFVVLICEFLYWIYLISYFNEILNNYLQLECLDIGQDFVGILWFIICLLKSVVEFRRVIL